MPIPLVPIIAAAASIAGSVISSRRAKKNTDQTIAANKEQAEYAYSKDLEMWNRNNEFNNPVSQMARLSDAGLNPNLVYGNGAVGNSSGTLPKYNAPTAEYNYKPAIDPQGMLSMYQDFQVRQAQIDNLKAQEQNTRVRTISEAGRQSLMELQGRTGEFDLERRQYLAPYQAAITGNKARASEAELEQSWQKLQNLKQDELLKILASDEKRNNLTTQQLTNERIQTEVIFNKYRNQWMKMGITTSDNPLLRIFTRMFSESGFNPMDMIGEQIRKIKN